MNFSDFHSPSFFFSRVFNSKVFEKKFKRSKFEIRIHPFPLGDMILFESRIMNFSDFHSLSFFSMCL